MKLLGLFLQSYMIPISIKTLKTLQSHPNYPSFASISDFLDELSVQNIAVKITKKELFEIPLPAFVHLQDGDEKEIALLKEIDEKKVIFINEKLKTIEDSIDSFSQKWTGEALLAEPNEHSGEVNYTQNQRKERFENIEKRVWQIGITVFFLLLTLSLNNLTAAGLGFSIIIGFVTSAFLLMSEYGNLPIAIAKICQSGNQISCNTVTKSTMSKIFDWFSWSEIGFLYFSGMFLNLLIGNFIQKSNEIASILLLLNLLALPYTLFSVYYQAFVVRKWCILCLVVMLSFWGNSFFSYLITDFSYSKESLFLSLFSFSLPITVWFIVKNILKNALKVPFLERQVQIYERDANLFMGFLETQEKKEIGHLSQEIIIGNPEAETTITTVCNPFCYPCAIAHKEVERLVTHFEDVRWIIRFVGEEGKESKRNQVIRHLFSLKPELQVQALHDWFEFMDFDSWKSKYPTEISLKSLAILEEQNAWAKNVDIRYTPTFFLNGVELVFPYDYTKLKYHLKNIINNTSINA